MLFTRVGKFVQKPLEIIFGLSYKYNIVSIAINISIELVLPISYPFISFMSIIIIWSIGKLKSKGLYESPRRISFPAVIICDSSPLHFISHGGICIYVF